MNHLHQFLSDDLELKWRLPESVSPETSRQALEVFRHIARDAQCFWMGDLQGWFHNKTERDRIDQLPREFQRLPYKTCWFECQFQEVAGPLLLCLLLHDDDELGIVAWMFRKYLGRLECRGTWQLDDATLSKRPTAALGVVDLREAVVLHYAALKFVAAMHCGNVTQKQTRPADRLNRARVKRGKKPLFSYWTLHLSRSEAGEALGGTHDSPRVHLRRGHPRQYAPGKYTWVQPHVVGNKTLGMVHKDYEGSRLAESAR